LPEPDAAASSEVDEAALLDELESLLQDAVRRQLTADVPVGVLLSGGVDSSLITAMARRVAPRLKTFNVRFPGHGSLDETEHARLIARHFDTEHVELEAQPTTAELLPRLARQFDEPMNDSSMIPTFLVCELVRRHCTVALGGDGGDELFGGYGGYSRLLAMQQQFRKAPLSVRSAVAFGAERVLPVGLRGRNWLQGLGADLERRLPLVAPHFSPTPRRRLMGRYAGWPLAAERVIAQRIPREPDLLQRATRMDFTSHFAEDILVKVDRASMLSSLEVRAPMLDYRLVEFAFRKVPSHLKATTVDRKTMLKRLTLRLLPAEFDRQRKQGFSIPLAAWLEAGTFRQMFQQVLLDPQVVFDQPMVRELLRGQDRGRTNGERLFGLVLFELWRREYRATI
jgi:asparagine synthase (glutamine-hydrolysing)